MASSHHWEARLFNAINRRQPVRSHLDWIDRLESLVRRHGRLAGDDQLEDHLRLYAAARDVYRKRLAEHPG
jgi:hypothetical protein